MKSRYTAIMKLVDETYGHYKCYGRVVKDSIRKCLEFQKEFIKNDVLLSNEEKKDMCLYITTYIVDIYLDEYPRHD